MAKKGQNVRYELMTTDTAAAQRFYTETIEWKTRVWDQAPADLPAEARGAPPHWLAYTQVDDVDAASQQAVKLGGKVVHGPFDLAKVGRMAILSDPQGAVFAVFKGVEDMPVSAPEGIGEFSWSELNTTDQEAAWSFYSQLFGWQHLESMDMGPGLGTYFMWSDPDKITRGGMFDSAKMMSFPPHWMHYVNVDDVPAALERIVRNGGKVLNGPETIPSGGVIAQCMDPQGGGFALFAPGKK